MPPPTSIIPSIISAQLEGSGTAGGGGVTGFVTTGGPGGTRMIGPGPTGQIGTIGPGPVGPVGPGQPPKKGGRSMKTGSVSALVLSATTEGWVTRGRPSMSLIDWSGWPQSGTA